MDYSKIERRSWLSTRSDEDYLNGDECLESILRSEDEASVAMAKDEYVIDTLRQKRSF